MLYCEGRHKPTCRGVLHYYASLPLSVIGFAVLYTKCKDVLALSCALLFSLCIFTCLFTSGLYHRCKWNRDAEQYISKLDHACILLVIFGSYLPFAFYAVPNVVGMYFASYLIFITIGGFYWIMRGGKSTILHLASASSLLSVLYYFHDTWFAIHAFLNLFIYFVGFVIFKLKKPDPLSNTFGYHEIFHVCVIVSMVYTYFVHYKIYSS